MITKKTIKPELPGGTRDMLPEEALIFFDFIEKITKVYRRFGFSPLETPCLEKTSVLTGDDESFDKTIFKTKVSKGSEDKDLKESELGEESSLRFDLTIPLARVVAAYPEIAKPFKRYQLGKVFRGERPQAGRFREFYQLDFDIIGAPGVEADLESIEIMYELMKELKIDNFLIKINSRKILSGLAEVLEITDKEEEFLRVIDKQDKVGLKKTLEELEKGNLKLGAKKIQEIKNFTEIAKQGGPEKIKDFFAGRSERGLSGAEEMILIKQGMQGMGASKENWQFDVFIARGLGYYNGPVFEIILKDFPEIGSVCSGGRYDGLTNRFIKNSNISGVGASVGIDRLIVALKKLKKINIDIAQSKVVVAVFDESLKKNSIEFARELRRNNVSAEAYLGPEMSLKPQISYALKKNAQWMVIIGPDEEQAGKVQLKNLAQRKQETIGKKECIERILNS